MANGNGNGGFSLKVNDPTEAQVMLQAMMGNQSLPEVVDQAAQQGIFGPTLTADAQIPPAPQDQQAAAQPAPAATPALPPVTQAAPTQAAPRSMRYADLQNFPRKDLTLRDMLPTAPAGYEAAFPASDGSVWGVSNGQWTQLQPGTSPTATTAPPTPAGTMALPPIPGAAPAGGTPWTGPAGTAMPPIGMTTPTPEAAAKGAQPEPLMGPQQQAQFTDKAGMLPFTGGGPTGEAVRPAPPMTSPTGGMMPTPPAIPPETMRQRILGTLGKIGGIGLSAVAPGIAQYIPQTPLGKIATQVREMRQQELQLGFAKAQADLIKAQAEATTAGVAAGIAAKGGPWDAMNELPGALYQKNTGNIKFASGLDGTIDPNVMIKYPEGMRPVPQDQVPLEEKNFFDRLDLLPPELKKQIMPNGQLPLSYRLTPDAKGVVREAQRNWIDKQITALEKQADTMTNQRRLAWEQRVKDEEGVLAQVPDPDRPGMTVQRYMPRGQAVTAGYTTTPVVSSDGLVKDEDQGNQANVVQTAFSSYKMALAAPRAALSSQSVNAMTDIININQQLEQQGLGGGYQAIANFLSGGVATQVISTTQMKRLGSDWNYLQQSGDMPIMANYLDAQASVGTYIRMLDNMARGLGSMQKSEAQLIPEPWVGADVAMPRMARIQQDIDSAIEGRTQFSNIQTPQQVRKRIEGAAPAAPAATAPAPAAPTKAAAPAAAPITRTYQGKTYTLKPNSDPKVQSNWTVQ